MKDTKYYTCDYCYKEFEPKRRRVQKYCSNSCRSSAYQQRKALKNNKKNAIDNFMESNVPQLPNKQKITVAGVGNAALGSLAADGVKSILTPRKNKPATKGDIELLLEKLGNRFHLIQNLPPNLKGEYPYFDLYQGVMVYLKMK